MEERVTQISAERQRIATALSGLGLKVFPSQANFIMFRSTECGVDGDELWHRLLAKSVLVRNCSKWPGLADCLRVTVGTATENNIFIEALEGAIK